jgi:hypothetical protein
MQNRDGLIKGARLAVRAAWAANRLFLAAVVIGFFCSWVFAGAFAEFLGRSFAKADLASVMAGMRFEMLLGIAMSAVTDRLLTALAAIVASAGAGDPFVAANVRWLRYMGWCLLLLQLLVIPGYLIGICFPAMGPAAPHPDISIAGWLSVLMIFVLARVFATGSAMRDDLEGTV